MKISAKSKLLSLSIAIFVVSLFGLSAAAFNGTASAAAPASNFAATVDVTNPPKKTCGGGSQAVTTSINIGCTGTGNPINDAAFAIIRFLSLGVGFIITGSLVVAGIQYTVSRGDPKATAEAIGRMRSTAGALLLFLFGYAILNFIIPGGFFK